MDINSLIPKVITELAVCVGGPLFVLYLCWPRWKQRWQQIKKKRREAKQRRIDQADQLQKDTARQTQAMADDRLQLAYTEFLKLTGLLGLKVERLYRNTVNVYYLEGGDLFRLPIKDFKNMILMRARNDQPIPKACILNPNDVPNPNLRDITKKNPDLDGCGECFVSGSKNWKISLYIDCNCILTDVRGEQLNITMQECWEDLIIEILQIMTNFQTTREYAQAFKLQTTSKLLKETKGTTGIGRNGHIADIRKMIESDNSYLFAYNYKPDLMNLSVTNVSE